MSSAAGLRGSTVAVTGAGRGLGRRLVDAALAREAATVYGLARRPEDVLAHPSVVAVRLDLTSPDSIAEAAAAVGRVDVLVNNAAHAHFDTALAAPMDAIRREFETNVLGTLELTRAVTAAMAHGAHLVNVASLLAYVTPPGMASYAATKHALRAFTEALRPVLAQRGITVHGVYPGGIDTDMLAAFSGRKADPQAVADAILDGVAAGEADIYPDAESRAFAASRRVGA